MVPSDMDAYKYLLQAAGMNDFLGLYLHIGVLRPYCAYISQLAHYTAPRVQFRRKWHARQQLQSTIPDKDLHLDLNQHRQFHGLLRSEMGTTTPRCESMGLQMGWVLYAVVTSKT